MAPRKSSTTPFIVAYGGEDYLLDRVITKAKAWEGRTPILLDGEDVSEEDLISECESFSFDGGPRVIVLDNANKMKTSKRLAAFIESKAADDVETVLVAIVRSDKLPAVWSKAAEKGKLQECPKFKPYEVAKITGRIVKEAKALNLELSPGMAELLLRALGNDLRKIANELNKLVFLVGRGVVQKEHVLAVVAQTLPVEPYQVAEAALAKNAKKAMDTLSLAYRQLGEGASVPVVFSLMRQVEKLVVARNMLDLGDSPEIVATRLDMHAYAFKKNLLPLAQKHSVKSLLGHMKTLCELETQVKGSARSKRTLVELAVLSIAAAV